MTAFVKIQLSCSFVDRLTRQSLFLRLWTFAAGAIQVLVMTSSVCVSHVQVTTWRTPRTLCVSVLSEWLLARQFLPDTVTSSLLLSLGSFGLIIIIIIIAVETMGAINSDGLEFLGDLGRRITQVTDDIRESAFLF